MRKLKKYIISVFIFCCIAFSIKALVPPIPNPSMPGAVTIDGLDDAIYFVDSAATAASSAQAQANAFIQNVNMQALSALSSYTGKFTGFLGGAFKKKEKQALPGTKEIKESKIADIYDPDSVQAALYELFFQYPRVCNENREATAECEEYKKAAKEFHQDTVIEIYIAVRQMEPLLESIETAINELENSLKEGKDGAEDPNNGENAVLKNMHVAYETMDTLLKIIVEIEAMRAQYIAAQAIGSFKVRAAEPDNGNNKSSENNVFTSEKIKIASSTIKYKQTLQFADSVSEKKLSAVKLDDTKVNNKEVNKLETQQKQPLILSKETTPSAIEKTQTLAPSKDNIEKNSLKEILTNPQEPTKEIKNQDIKAQTLPIAINEKEDLLKELSETPNTSNVISSVNQTVNDTSPLKSILSNPLTTAENPLITPIKSISATEINPSLSKASPSVTSIQPTNNFAVKEVATPTNIVSSTKSAPAAVATKSTSNTTPVVASASLASSSVKKVSSSVASRISTSNSEIKAEVSQINKDISLQEKEVDPILSNATEISKSTLNTSTLSKEKSQTKQENKILSNSSSLNVKNDTSPKEIKEEEDDEEEEKLTFTRSVTFKKAPSSGLESPFAGNEENMALLQNMSEAYEKLQDAFEVHNLIKTLDNIQAMYDWRNKSMMIYEKALDSLKKTEQCTINYYGAMYDNPREMWNGGLSESQAANHELRKGLSGWIYNAYTLAKAEDTGMVVNSDSISEADVNTDSINRDNMEAADSQISNMMDFNQSGFKSPEEEKKATASLKESERIVWNIGTEASKMLAKDQANSQYDDQTKLWKGRWGNAKIRYPVWNDLKSYYNQYIEGKYARLDGENIEEGAILKKLLQVNLNTLAINLAKEINKLLDSTAEKNFNNTEINKLSDAINQETQEASSDIDALVAAKKAELDALYQEKENKLKKIQAKENKINEQVRKIQIEIDNLVAQRQKAEEEVKEAEATISAMETLVNRMLERRKTTETYIKKIEEEYKHNIDASIIDKVSYNEYKSIYQNNITIASAQLSESVDFQPESINSEISLDNNIKKNKVKTYTRVIETEEEEELDEPDTITMAQATIEENQQKVLKLKAEINALTEKINKLSQDKTDTEALIKREIEPEREKINTEYVDNSYAVVVKHNALIEAAEQKHAQTLRIFSNLNLAEYYESKFGKPRLVILDQVYDTNLLGILRTANKLISETQDAAKSLVLESAESMKGLGENLYNPNYHSQIIEIHKQLINDLKNIPMRHMSKEGHEAINSYTAISNIIKSLREMYSAFIVNDACVHVNCDQADDEYFISNSGRRKDFVAPKVVPDSYLPSVRETVYFDFRDYDVIARNSAGYITPQELLSKLSYIPEIWKMILKTPAYVEKDIDLSRVIVPSLQKFANSGLYPCWYLNQNGEKEYLVTVGKGSKYLKYDIYYITNYATDIFGQSLVNVAAEKEAYKKLLEKNYATCQNLEITGNGVKKTIKSVAEDVKGTTELKLFSSFKPAEEGSELGYIFEHDGVGIKYNQYAGTAFSELSKADQEMDKEESIEGYIYNQTSLANSQIGEFLKAIDSEQSSYQNILEVKADIEEAIKSLYEMFKKMDIKVSENLDLSKDEDYNLARNKLLGQRDKLLSQAISKVSSVQGNDNEVVKERLNKINNMIKMLQKDNEAYVMLDESMAPDASLDEKIITEKVNRKVMSTQKEEADKSFMDQMRRVGKVYCGQLVDNM